MDANRLKMMLSGAKQVMDKVNENNFKVKSNTHSNYSNSNVELLEKLPPNVTPKTNPTRVMGNSYPNLSKSKMPEHIKRAMVENPIPKLEMGSGGGPTFSLEDVKDIINTPQQNYQPPQNSLNESTIVNSQGQRLITMTEAELDKKIQDALLNFMATTFTKNLTENTIKKTITTLIKEGKIKVKQKPIK